MPASYPTSLAQFMTYQDQPGNPTTWPPDPTNPGATIDLTLDRAGITNKLGQEIVAVETTIGSHPFSDPGCTNLGQTVIDLYKNKAGLGHNHIHATCSDLKADAHPQYMPTTGDLGRPGGFKHPVPSPGATKPTQYINLAQAQGAGIAVGTISNAVKAGMPHNAIRSPSGQRFKIQGGYTSGYTDGSGNLFVPFNPPFQGVLTFLWNKMPFPGGSMLGWYAYQYMEDQLILMGLSNEGALIQFIEDIVVDARALVCMAWVAIGV
jgi:hypothetical protein